LKIAFFCFILTFSLEKSIAFGVGAAVSADYILSALTAAKNRS